MQYFKEHLDNHIDLVSRRILNEETIPHSEKVFSLFEPYTEWIKKGKAGNRPELGLNIAVATDQFSFILFHRVMEKQHDKDLAVPMTEAILSKYDVGSMSFDKNFWTKENQHSATLAQLFILGGLECIYLYGGRCIVSTRFGTLSDGLHTPSSAQR
ncbi:hypothetical protein IIA28_19965 [candidate division KSB1 bacterium]|nr:hypothetical protein [candidate division KSB1 bacterium]